MTITMRAAGSDSRALIIAPAVLQAWTSRLEQDAGSGLRISLLDEQGTLLAGQPLSTTTSSVRRARKETSLPWTLSVVADESWQASTEFQERRRLFTAGLVALGLLLSGGSYLLWRVVQRELAIARLQAEFVSAVSHEFRTPVTSLRHVIELLQEDDEVPKERRSSFYEVLARSTERLDRLVESLLDFGRMESGRKPYDLQPLDVEGFVREVVREFESAPAARGFRVEVNVSDLSRRTVLGDATSLGHAVWNLLDNAVKYSPDRTRVTLALRPHGDRSIGIAVSDEGIGVPRSERGDIFLKFVRGAQANRLGIKGTGVGLAIVSHIVRAHGGSVELESREGHGSTFTLVLPAAS
jgi:signal transduction histidine kinase